MYLSVYITCGSKKEGERIARTLVRDKLAACVNLFPCTSIYRWKRKIEKSSEYIAICKTKRDKYKKLEEKVLSIHSYELPGIVGFSPSIGNKKFLKWIDESTSG